MADVNTGDNAVLRMEVSVTATFAAANYHRYHWKLSLIERTGSVYGWSGSTGASVEIFWDNGAGYAVAYSGSFAWDFRGGGQQSVTIAEGDSDLGNYSDGSARGFTFRGNLGSTGTSTAGGPASVDQWIVGGDTRVVPGVPSSVALARVTDTQLNLTWNNSGSGNAAPQTNDYEVSINDGAFGNRTSVNATTAATVSSAANEKRRYRVRAWNPAGASAWSTQSNAVYTTPAAPTAVTAVKDASQNIVINFTKNVAYAEHTHEVWHGTVSGGVTTWDGAALTTLAANVTTYTHVAPNTAQVHVYRVRAVGGGLQSAYATSSSVQLLAPPNAPTIPAMASFADKAAVLTFAWQHNPVDTTAQTAYEFQYSTNGGSSWTGTGKVVSTSQQATRPSNTYAANTVLTMRVRTWGQAATGGADGTGASDWSVLKSITFKTAPTTSITSPANGSNYSDATLRTSIGFTQAEAATFVKAELELKQGATLLEELESTIRTGITFDTPVDNGISYTIRARVQDSNGLWSAWVSSTFNVVYLPPVTPVVSLSYVESTGFGQVNLTIGAPGAGESAATLVTVTRSVDGGPAEVLVQDYPVSPVLAFFDTTATIHGTNTYTVTTSTALGAQKSVTANLVTNELRRAFLSKGPSFNVVGVFGGNLSVNETLGVASDTIQAAGRTKPIGLYGTETSVDLKVTSFIFEGFGSTIPELRNLLLVPGRACFRDASGRRVFGTVKGGLSYKKAERADLNFTMTETS